MTWSRTFTLSRTLRCRVKATPEVLALASMFGLGIDEEQVVELYKDLELTVGSGRVIYITGDSGGGKSTLLRDLRDAALAELEHPICVYAAGLNTGDPPADGPADAPLVSALGVPVKEAVELLTLAGISDAFVWLRTEAQLSDGQRERFRLCKRMLHARALRRKNPDLRILILIDEFCARLDRKTAIAVAYQLRKVAAREGLCFAVATTHTDLADDLGWNQRVYLSLGAHPVSEQSP